MDGDNYSECQREIRDLKKIIIKTIESIIEGDNLSDMRIENMDCYRMTRLLFEDLLPVFYLNSDTIKNELLKLPFWERREVMKKHIRDIKVIERL